MKRTALKRWIPFRLAALVAPLIAAWPQRTQAADGTWTGTTSAVWHTITNWSPNTAFPGANGATANADTAIFSGTVATATVGLNMNTAGGTFSLGGLDFNRSVATAMTLGNNSGTNGVLRLNGSSTIGGSTLIRVQGSADLTLSGAGVSGGTGTMGVQLGITNGVFNVATSRTLTISSIISQLTTGSGFTKQGAGTLILSGANTYTGTTTVTAGTVRATVAGALGTGTAAVNMNGGNLVLFNDAATSYGRNVTVSADSTITTSRAAAGAGVSHTLGTLSIGTNTLTTTSAVANSGTQGLVFGAATLTGNATFNVPTVASMTNALTLASIGESGGTRNLVKTGSSLMVVQGASTYSGTTTVNDGILRIQNATGLGTGTSQVVVTNNDRSANNTNEIQFSSGITINRNILLEDSAVSGTVGNARSGIQSTNSVNANANTWGGTITVKGGSNQTISAGSAPLNIAGSILNDNTTPSSAVFFRGGNTGTLNAGITVNLGSATFFKTDGGTWIANSAFTAGAVQVADGTLTIGTNNAIGTSVPVTIGQGSNTSGTLNIASGISQTLSGLTVASGSTGTQRITGPGSLDTGNATRTYLINDSVGIPQDLIISAPITGTGLLSKTGTGTLAINGSSAAPVDLTDGRLEGVAAYNGGLTLSGGILSPGTDITPGSITATSLTTSGTPTINLNVGSAGEVLGNTGGITASGTTTINLTPAGSLPNSGHVPLITHNGSFVGTAGFALGPLFGRVLGNIDNNGSAITLNITGNDRVIWTGAAGAPPTGEAWDINTTQNWKLQSNSNPTGFLQGDDIIFDGTGANALNVTLNTVVNPARAEFTNNSGDATPSYIIKGSGGMAGTMVLDKTGTGSVTLAPVQAPAAANTSAHTYTGQTTVANGTLTLDYTGLTGTNAPSATVLGSVTPVAVASGATLNIVRDNQQTNFANNLSGNGTLVVDITNGGTAGPRNFAFTGNNASFSGNIKLSPTGGGTAGTFRTINATVNGAAPAAAFGTASIEVDPGGQWWGAAATYANNFTIAGAGYAEAAGGAVPDAELQALGFTNYAGIGAMRMENGSVFNGSITLDGAAKIQPFGGTATVNGSITNTAGQVLVVGGGNNNAVNTLILTGDNSGLEQIWVNSGGSGGTSAFDLLQIGNGGTTGTLGSGNVTLHADAARGAILRIARSDGYTLASGQQILADVTGATVADLVRTRLDLNVTGAGFDNAGNTIDLRDAGANGGDIFVGNTVAGALARLTGTIEARAIQVGVLNTAVPTPNAVLNLGKADGSAVTTVNVNSLNLGNGGNTAPLGNTNNATINIHPGVTMTVTADVHLGEQNSSTGIINQTGGSVTVGGHSRIGHWPNNSSAWNVSGGSLNFNGANPAANPSGGAEQATGGFYVGVDGTGAMNISGSGTVSTKWAVLDNRTATPGIDSLNITSGGTFNLGDSGGTTQWGLISRNPGSSTVNINGGSLNSVAGAGSALPIDTIVTIGASGGTVDTSANATSSVVLMRDVTGAGNSLTLTGSGTLALNPSSKTTADGISDGLGSQIVSANLNGGTMPVNKLGTGTTTLSGTNTYSGATTVTAGRLNLTGSIANSDLTAASGSTLSGEGSAKTIALAGGGNLLIDGTSAGALTSLGGLTAAGVTNVDFSAPPATSIVTVLNHGGTAATPANFALVNAASYRTSIFAVNAGDVTLDTGRKNLTWAGTTGTWEIAGTDLDWNAGGDNFFYGDAITFNDSNGTNSTVALTGTLAPSGVTVNSDTNQFVLNGSAGNLIGGTGSLLKDGTSTLTVNAPNTYSGGTVISEGEFFSRNAAAAGTGGITLGDANTATATDAPAFIADVNGAAASITTANPLTVASTSGPVAIIGSTASNPVGILQANFSGALTLNDDVKLQTGAGDFTRFQGVVSGTGNIEIVNGSLTGDTRGNGGNRVILSGNANGLTGNITVKAGTATNYTVFQTDAADIINNNSGVTVEDNAVFRLNANEGIDGLTGSSGARVRGVVAARTITVGLNNASSTFAGSLENDPFDAGSLALTKSGTGTLILSGTNTNTGATTVNGGTLQVGSGGATGQLGAGAVTLAAGTTLSYNRTGLVTQAGAMNGAAGAGTLNINGDNSTAVVMAAGGNFSGIINVNGGALVAGATNPWSTHLTAPTFNIASGAALAFGSSSAHAHIGALNLSGGTVTTAPGGTGSYDGENFQLNGNVTVTGTVPSTITRDPARTNADSGISLRGVRTFDVADVTGSAAVDLFVSTELENTDAATVTAAGPGGIIKTGLGTMSLSGIHSYTGPTTVNGGTLRLETGSSIAASSLLTVNSGSAVTGNGSTGPMVLAAGSTISPGSSPGLLTTGTVTVSATTNVIMEIGGLTPVTQFDQVSTTGALNLDGGLLTVSLIGGYIPNAYDAFDIWLNDGADPIGGTAATFSGLPEGTQISIPSTTGGLGGGLDSDYWIISYFGGDGNDIRLTYVPEPSSAMLAGAFGLLALSRRRRKA